MQHSFIADELGGGALGYENSHESVMGTQLGRRHVPWGMCPGHVSKSHCLPIQTDGV